MPYMQKWKRDIYLMSNNGLICNFERVTVRKQRIGLTLWLRRDVSARPL